jgi:hypothetical protein
MTKKSFDRRSFLLSTVGLGGLLGLSAGSNAARAFSYESIPPMSGLGAAFANRCSADAQHAQLLAKLEQDLAARSGVPGSTISATAYCPFCGCPVIATRTIE